MNLKLGLAVAVFAAAASSAASALAQEAPYLEQRERAPNQALEITLGMGYTQGFGRIQGGAPNVVGAGPVNDVAGPGLGIEGGLAYRLAPHWSIGATAQYQEFANGDKNAGDPYGMSSGSAARGLVGSIDGTFHINPYQRLDPWVRLGTGYRMLWEVHPSPAPTYMFNGFDWAKLAIGADIRTSPDVSLAPMVGADLNTFLWQDGASRVAIGDLRLNTFLYAGLQGRFDFLGTRESGTAMFASR